MVVVSGLVNLLKSRWAGPLAAATVAVVLYAPTVGYQFVYDDVGIIEADARLDEPTFGLTCWVSPWWPKGSAAPATRPLTTFTFWLQTQLHGRWPAGFHAVNVLLFAAVCAMVGRLTGRWLGRDEAGWLAGLLFAVHPIHVEVVSNVVGRAELAAALFIAWGLDLWLKWREALTWRRAVALGAMVLAAGLSKEHGYLLAAMYAVVEIGQRRYLGRPIFRPIPLNVVVVILCVVVLAVGQRAWTAQRVKVDERLGVAQLDNPLQRASLGERIVTPFMLVGQAARLLVVPYDQSPDYSPRVLMPTRRLDRPLVLAGLAVVAGWVALVVAGWWGRRRWMAVVAVMAVMWWIPSNTWPLIGTIFGERLLTGLSIFTAIGMGALPWHRLNGRLGRLVAVVGGAAVLVYVGCQWAYWRRVWGPVSGVVEQGVSLTWDVWLPMGITMTALVGWGTWAWRQVRPAAAVMTAALLAGGYGAATCFYNPTWSDRFTHGVVTVFNHPRSGRFQGFLAGELVERGIANPQARDVLFAEAEKHAMEALKLWPRQPEVYAVLGVVAEHRGQTERARQLLRAARRAEWDINLGDYGLYLMGELPNIKQMEQRAEALRKRLEAHPDDVQARRELAFTYADLKENKKALAEFEKLVTPQTTDARLLHRYLDVLLAEVDLDKAYEVYRNWARCQPDRWPVLCDAALLAIATGRDMDQARQWIDRARRLAPLASEPWAALGQWYLARGQEKQAIEAFYQAIERTTRTDPKRWQYQLVLDRLLDRP